jgi:histone H3/H4
MEASTASDVEARAEETEALVGGMMDDATNDDGSEDPSSVALPSAAVNEPISTKALSPEASSASSPAAAAAPPALAPPTAVDFEPPLACVRRILKNYLPSNTNVGKDASAAFARACGIFIIYLTACANDYARFSKRQTITANDVFAAIKVSSGDRLTSWIQFFFLLQITLA